MNFFLAIIPNIVIVLSMLIMLGFGFTYGSDKLLLAEILVPLNLLSVYAGSKFINWKDIHLTDHVPVNLVYSCISLFFVLAFGIVIFRALWTNFF